MSDTNGSLDGMLDTNGSLDGMLDTTVGRGQVPAYCDFLSPVSLVG